MPLLRNLILVPVTAATLLGTTMLGTTVLGVGAVPAQAATAASIGLDREHRQLPQAPRAPARARPAR